MSNLRPAAGFVPASIAPVPPRPTSCATAPAGIEDVVAIRPSAASSSPGTPAGAHAPTDTPAAAADAAGTTSAAPALPPAASQASRIVVSPAPVFLHVPQTASALLAPTYAGQGAAPDLGTGFPPVRAEPQSLARSIHDFLSGNAPGLFNAALDLTLSRISGVTERGLGVNVHALLDAERTMYRLLVPSRDGYVGGSPPIFQRLAEGQAAYVYLRDHPEASDLLTRLYSGLPPENLEAIGPGNDAYTPVRRELLARLQRGDFATFVDVDGRFETINGTESIAMESMASIARRENGMGTGFADPTIYYHWLVTRAESAFQRCDPWLYDVKPALHSAIGSVKSNLTPPWVTAPNSDPFGSVPYQDRAQDAYTKVMAQAGGGRPPSIHDLADFADTAISLDRDLLFGVQTYWSKLLREVSPDQRASLFLPLARSWVSLNCIAPADAAFDLVSPSTAPYIELVDHNDGNRTVLERYDRAMALSEVVSHTLAGLGIEQRKALLSTLVDEVRARKDDIAAREQRVRQILGPSYIGLDVEAILDGRLDGSRPEVRTAFDQLQHALNNGFPLRPMTPEHAEMQRHLSVLAFMAERRLTYREPVQVLADRLPPMTGDPLFVGQYYEVENGVAPTPLPPGPSRVDRWGPPDAPHTMPASIVFEGGGGKGFAYIECLKRLKEGLRDGGTSVAVDHYLGTSAGAITAGLLASGFNENELSSVMQQLDFKKFYADYLWLAGGVDPQVRGFERSGLFTTRQMYRTLDALLRLKTGVEGRPVLFRDLPFKLSVVATVLNTNLPDDLKQQLGIGKDGQIVFSSEKTPNMDVAAAISGSAAVPTFFNAPQMLVVRDEPDGKGATVRKEYRLQLVDGGAVNNFPVALAKGDNPDTSCLFVAPAYYQAPGPSPNDPPVSLSTLDFDPSKLDAIDAFNRGHYAAFAPKVGDLLSRAQASGMERAVIGFNLTTAAEQPSPIVQGATREQSQQMRALADQVGIETVAVEKAASDLRRGFPRQAHRVEEKLLDALLDRGDVLSTPLCGRPEYHIGTNEASGLSDVLAGVTAAQVVAPYEVDQKLFEKA